MPRRRRSARVVEDAASLPRRAAPVCFPAAEQWPAHAHAPRCKRSRTRQTRNYRLLWLSAARIEEGDECGDAGARAARSGPTAHRRELTRAECGGTRRRGRARTARPRAPDRHTDTKARHCHKTNGRARAVHTPSFVAAASGSHCRGRQRGQQRRGGPHGQQRRGGRQTTHATDTRMQEAG
ncbi:hypothetical protein ERJ75_000807300 [Trypanosoma vivax]|nr:hypothetical protein ERJ75_000807300 [Trypanosoma vivax]